MTNFTDYFRSPPVTAERESSPLPAGLRWLLDWESWLTLALVMIVFLSVARSIDAQGLRSGTEELWDRWAAWIEIVRSGGISSDTMPFVTMVMAFAWIAGYLSSWSIFRWQNAWVALV